jgi:hypothetical protein
VRAAAAIFVQRVVRDAEERFEPGIARLRAVLDSWLWYMERDTFAGGCFFAAAAVEMDGRPGPVRDAVAAQMTSWVELLTEYLRTAIERGELAEDTDPAQLAFEFDALGTAVNSGWQLHDDTAVFERGRRAIAGRLAAAATDAGRAVLAAGAA